MHYRKMFDKLFLAFPRVRASDPVTSFEAADSIREYAPQHYQRIVDCLLAFGPLGKDGIAQCTNLDGNQVARRLNEMHDLGMIELTGNKVKSNANRSEREWKAVKQ